ncbi:hypothetical protein GCM10025864_11670 [Luteimicrobium album]|uniref:Uncharacterized protein n=1 Tax=Luteimicrobium album TaxID=1054550 RepID=A0ABQ6I0D2_9MICO|nr:hypothetical protein GCM10025864_11670 [Luteimicrobium album]
MREGPLQLGGLGLVAAQVRLELRVVVGHDVLRHLDVQRVLLRGHGVGEGLVVVVAVVVVGVAGLGEDVRDPVERGLLPDGQLERHELVAVRAERGPQVREDRLEVGARLVLLRHDDDTRHPRVARCCPRRPGPGLDAVGRAHDDGRDVRDRERRVDLAGEVGVAGRVEEREGARRAVGPGPGRVRDAERERHAARDLLGLRVGHGAAVLDPAGPRDRAGDVEDRLGERRLAGAPVPDECDHPDR